MHNSEFYTIAEFEFEKNTFVSKVSVLKAFLLRKIRAKAQKNYLCRKYFS